MYIWGRTISYKPRQANTGRRRLEVNLAPTGEAGQPDRPLITKIENNQSKNLIVLLKLQNICMLTLKQTKTKSRRDV